MFGITVGYCADNIYTVYNPWYHFPGASEVYNQVCIKYVLFFLSKQLENFSLYTNSRQIIYLKHLFLQCFKHLRMHEEVQLKEKIK